MFKQLLFILTLFIAVPGFSAPNSGKPAANAPSGGGGGGGTGDITDIYTCITGNCDALTAAAGDSLNMAAGDSSTPSPVTATLPGTCTEGQEYQDTDSGGSEVYRCTALNTWTKYEATTDTHLLGGAKHSADTWANVASKISDTIPFAGSATEGGTATAALVLDQGASEHRVAYDSAGNCYFRDKDRDDSLDLADGELCYAAHEYWVANPVADLQTAINSVCTEPDDLDRNAIIRIPGGDYDFGTTAITIPDPCNGLIIQGAGRRPFRDGWLTGDNAVGTSLNTSLNGDFITVATTNHGVVLRDFEVTVSSVGASTRAIVFGDSAAYWKVQNVGVRTSDQSNSANGTGLFADDPQVCVIENSDFQNLGIGINVNGTLGSGGCVITRNHIRAQATTGRGIVVDGTSPCGSLVIRDNTFEGLNVGIDVSGSTCSPIVSGNHFEGPVGSTPKAIAAAGGTSFLVEGNFQLGTWDFFNRSAQTDSGAWDIFVGNEQSGDIVMSAGKCISTPLTDGVGSITACSEPTLDDQAATITANWVNTANPWADNEVANNITVDLATAATSAAKLDNGAGEVRVAYSTAKNCYFRDLDRDDVFDAADGEHCYSAHEVWIGEFADGSSTFGLQEAINSVCTSVATDGAANFGGIVNVPSGVFNFGTNYITIPTLCYVWVKGQGTGSRFGGTNPHPGTVLKFDLTSGGDAFTFTGPNQHWRVTDLLVQFSNVGAGSTVFNVPADNDHWLIENVYTIHSSTVPTTGVVIDVTDAQSFLIYNNRLEGMGTAISIAGSEGNGGFQIANNKIRAGAGAGAGTTGILISGTYPCVNGQITNNVIETSNRGVDATSTSSACFINMQGNYFEPSEGANMEDVRAATNAVFTFVGNFFNPSSAAAFHRVSAGAADAVDTFIANEHRGPITMDAGTCQIYGVAKGTGSVSACGRATVNNVAETVTGAWALNGSTTFGSTITNSAANGTSLRRWTHATDCTGLTVGALGDECYEQDADFLYTCEPTVGGCDTAAEWRLTGDGVGGGGSLDGLSDVTISAPADAALLIKGVGAADWTDQPLSGDGSIGATGVLEVTQADALETNPTDCAAGLTANQIDASGNINTGCLDPIEETEMDTLAELDTQIGTTGTADATTFLRGDNSWAVPSGGSGLTHAQVMSRVSLGF